MPMQLIGKEIIDYLAENVALSFPCVKICDYSSVTKLSVPLMTVKEIPTSTGVFLQAEDGSSQPFIVRNVYELEIYAKQSRVKGKPMTAADFAMQIFIEADKLLNERFGLTMSGTPNPAPYPADTQVHRIVARYSAYIDTRTNQILRNI